MAKSKGKTSGTGRLSWDGRLWDPSGVLYEREVEELTRSEALALVRDPDIQVAVSHASRPLRWLASDQRQTVWLEEVDPNFHDEPNWKPPTGAPGRTLGSGGGPSGTGREAASMGKRRSRSWGR